MGSADGGTGAIAGSFVLAALTALDPADLSLHGLRSLAANALIIALFLLLVAMFAQRTVRRTLQQTAEPAKSK